MTRIILEEGHIGDFKNASLIESKYLSLPEATPFLFFKICVQLLLDNVTSHTSYKKSSRFK